MAHLKGKPTCTLLVPYPVLRPPSCQKGAVALLKGAVVPTGLLCLVKEERPGGVSRATPANTRQLHNQPINAAHQFPITK